LTCYDRCLSTFISKLTKQRTDHVVDILQTTKDHDRRTILVCNDLARQYRVKVDQLDTKHQQIHQLHTDFEQKVQQKQVSVRFM
jgi:gluconate kinase